MHSGGFKYRQRVVSNKEQLWRSDNGESILLIVRDVTRCRESSHEIIAKIFVFHRKVILIVIS